MAFLLITTCVRYFAPLIQQGTSNIKNCRNAHLEQLFGVVMDGDDVGDPESFHLLLITKDIIAKMLQPILMTTFSSYLFVGKGGRAKEYKEPL
jgi:hypothetical protein